MLAIVVHVSVTGDQSSAWLTAPLTPTASVVTPPPVARTVPSGKIVRVWKVRGKTMAAVARHAGEGLVMSRTNVVGSEANTGMSGSVEVPVFTTLPGRYIAELPPSTATGSTTDQVCVARSSTWLTMASSAVLAARTRPSGSTNICG